MKEVKEVKEDYTQQNKMIALFMGATVDTTERRMPEGEGTWLVGLTEFPHPMHESSLKYHTSWDWLKPVIDKAYDETSEHDMQHAGLALFELGIGVDIEMAYVAVVNFVKWKHPQPITIRPIKYLAFN